MLDPIPTFAVQAIIAGGDATAINDLARVLRGSIPWQPRRIPSETVANWQEIEPAPADTRIWEAHVGDWQLNLFDFDISEQEGHKPGDRGQNVTMSNRRVGLTIMSDGIMQHEVARWLLQRMDQYGGGKSSAAFIIKPN